MSLPVPLSVRLKTSKADVHVRPRNIRPRSVVPGGFASVEIALDRPLSVDAPEIQHFGDVFVYDGRHGGTVWQGRLMDPGRSASAEGEVWTLVAEGPAAHARDRSVPLVYVDGKSDQWVRQESSLGNSRTEIESDDDGVTTFRYVFSEGATIATDDHATMIYRGLRSAGMFVARVRALVGDGGTSTLWEDQLLTKNPAGTPDTADSDTWNTTARFIFAELGGTPALASDHDLIYYRSQRVGSSGAATANSWAHFENVIVRGRLKDKSGNDITSGYTSNTVTADEIVEDLLGRLLNKYDGAKASVAANSFAIDQLAFPDGAHAADVLADLMLIHPDHYWAAWEGDPARFEWKAWPTNVRYEASADDGFESPSSGAEVYNEVTVRWVDGHGRPRANTRTQTVASLDDAGLTRTAQLDLGDVIGSSALADRVGDKFLADHAGPQNRGTLTIKRAILDLDAGRMVQPWEILPGYLVRVRDVQPRVDALNATTNDAVTVFKIQSHEYDAASNVATLDLDQSSRRLDRFLARREVRRRR